MTRRPPRAVGDAIGVMHRAHGVEKWAVLRVEACVVMGAGTWRLQTHGLDGRLLHLYVDASGRQIDEPRPSSGTLAAAEHSGSATDGER